jgi:hypothetical protein
MILVGVEFFDRLDRDNLPHSICEFGLAKAGIPPHTQQGHVLLAGVG